MFYATNVLNGLALAVLATLAAASPIDLANGSLSERFVCNQVKLKNTIVVGDGNPHQNFVYKQVSPSTSCTGNPGGSATVDESISVGYSLSLAGQVEFITAGFEVSVSTSTGYSNTFGCGTVDDDGKAGTHTGPLCIFERIQLTAYTVNTKTCTVNPCKDTTCTNDTGPNTIIYAPNTVQGSCFYDNFQLNIPCGILGSTHYVYSGPAGGPQFIGC